AVAEVETTLRPGQQVADHLEDLALESQLEVVFSKQAHLDGHEAKLCACVLRVLAPEDLLNLVGREEVHAHEDLAEMDAGSDVRVLDAPHREVNACPSETALHGE